MKLTKTQLRRIIKEERSRLLREYEVPHERQAAIYDHPDYQRGYEDAAAGRPKTSAPTPEYVSGYSDGEVDAEEEGLILPRQLAELIDHEMYAKDDELRKLGDIITEMVAVGTQGEALVNDMGMRYGELAALGSYAKMTLKSTRELAEKFEANLDDLSRSHERGWYNK